MFALSLEGVLLCAQALPELPVDKSVTRGTLPNGVEYFLVASKTQIGIADFVLIQKGRSEVASARESLSSLPHFHSAKPYEFLSRHGIGYSATGFINKYPAAVSFHFRNVPVNDWAVSDSTLLITFDLMDTHSSDQALILCGDIDVAKILERMKVLSMMVSDRRKSDSEFEYKWMSWEGIKVNQIENATEDVVNLLYSYSAPRSPREVMNTAQPLVSEAFAYELGSILEKRINKIFRGKGIAAVNFRYRYSNSSAHNADETYSIGVSVHKDKMAEANRIISSILADLDTNGAIVEEFQDARDKLMSLARRELEKTTSNYEFVQRCESAFLYGTNLAPRSVINEYFFKRQLPVEQELAFFNSYIQALISNERNLAINVSVPKGEPRYDEVVDDFNAAWNGVSQTAYRQSYKADYADTSALVSNASRLKVKTVAKEPLSGGELWTFSNGMKVVYKKVPGSSCIDYNLMLKGGTSTIPDLQPGESAFVGDMLFLGRIAGMDGNDFRNMLSANGITMDVNVSAGNMQISGTVPNGKVQLLLKSLLAIANGRASSFNGGDLSYFKAGEELSEELQRYSQDAIIAKMDSLMFPDFPFGDVRNASVIDTPLQLKSCNYFNEQFSKVNDGVLVLFGGVDAEKLKQTLSRSLGAFKVSSKHASRPASSFKSDERWVTVRTDATSLTGTRFGTSVNMAYSVSSPFSLEQYLTFRVASKVMEKQIVRNLSGLGMYASFSRKVGDYPTGRMTFYVVCRPCLGEGLPAGVEPVGAVRALEALRFAVARSASGPLSDSLLSQCKQEVLNEVKSESAVSENMMKLVVSKYSDNNDMLTGYADVIKNISKAGVLKMLSEMGSGSRVEYIIK